MNPLRLIWILTLAVGLTAAACDRTEPTPAEQRADDSSNVVDDAAITTEVKAKLASDVELATLTGIDVDTRNGVVTLTGSVETETVKRKAEDLAKSVDGVIRVTNNLHVTSAGAGAASN